MWQITDEFEINMAGDKELKKAIEGWAGQRKVER